MALQILKYSIISIFVILALVALLFYFWTKSRPGLLYSARGNDKPVFHINAPVKKISIADALKSAAPYLDLTLKLRIKKRGGTNYDNVTTYVMYLDGWYYIFMDNYPWKAPVLEVPGSQNLPLVRVHADTGEVIAPVEGR